MRKENKSIRYSNKYRKQLFVYGFFTFLFTISPCFSQEINYLEEQEYTSKKASGQLNPFEFLSPASDQQIPVFTQESTSNQRASGCTGFVEDIGPAYVMNWNTDDGSAPLINLPFTFCFFGDSYTSVFMNNNGNISFLAPNSSFNPFAFPSNINRIIAGFWADFDFGQCGTMHTNITATAAIFTWKDVGYYDEKCDKKNTLQIIITDGTDPLIDNGNVAIHYGDMNWTTGDASQGTDGFGGIPASCGANRGNNIDYFQIGFFDHTGSDYDGPAGQPDGIDWLDDRSFYFDFCSSNGNIAPIPVYTDNCFPFPLCSVGDTLLMEFPFISPENNQVCSVTFDAPTLSNVEIVSSVVDFTGVLTIKIPGDNQIFGLHSITITGTDNAPIPASTSITFQIDIFDGDTVIPIVPQLTFQNGCAPITLALDDSTFSSYSWSTGGDQFTETLFDPINGNISVTVERQGCKVKIDTVVNVPPTPFFHFEGDFVYCFGEPYTSLSLSDSIVVGNIEWNTVINNTSDLYYTAYLSEGEYPIKLWDPTNTCANDTVITIGQFDVLSIVKPFFACDSNFVMTGNTGGSNEGYWSTNDMEITILSMDSLNTNCYISSIGSYEMVYHDTFCNQNDTLPVIYSDKPYFSFEPFDTICKTGTLSIEITDSLVMNWVNWEMGVLPNSTQYYYGLTVGDHHIQIENQYGCQNDTVIHIDSFDSPDLIHSGLVCGDTFSFVGSQGFEQGYWSVNSTDGFVSFENGSRLSTLITVSDYGSYFFEYSDSLCGEKDTIQIQFLPYPKGTIIEEPFCDGINQYIIFQNDVEESDCVLLWNTGDTLPSIIANDEGIYYLSISNACGIFHDSAYIVNIGCAITVPNVFTPNEDQINDFFELVNIGSFFTNFTFTIFNRWGTEIISFDQPTFQWNGKDKNNVKLADGVYYYQLEIQSGTQRKTQSGFFHLVD